MASLTPPESIVPEPTTHALTTFDSDSGPGPHGVGSSWRTMAVIGVLVAGVIGGAAIGAAARPSPVDRFTADATILVPRSASADDVRRLPAIVTLPQVIER